jgi:hypothetical protein
MFCSNCNREIQGGAGDGCDKCGYGYIDENVVTLKDGRKMRVVEQEARGMAGEPFTWVEFIDRDGDSHTFTELEEKFTDEDRKWLNEWLDDIAKTNYAMAIRYSQ